MPRAKSIDKLRRDKREGRHWSYKKKIKLHNSKKECQNKLEEVKK